MCIFSLLGTVDVLIAALMTSLVPKPRTPLTKAVVTARCEQKDRNQVVSGFLRMEVVRGLYSPVQVQMSHRNRGESKLCHANKLLNFSLTTTLHRPHESGTNENLAVDSRQFVCFCHAGCVARSSRSCFPHNGMFYFIH